MDPSGAWCLEHRSTGAATAKRLCGQQSNKLGRSLKPRSGHSTVYEHVASRSLMPPAPTAWPMPRAPCPSHFPVPCYLVLLSTQLPLLHLTALICTGKISIIIRNRRPKKKLLKINYLQRDLIISIVFLVRNLYFRSV